ncbi:hypothetical protein HispidOSU_007222 [Sigmodon hispidus]
MLFTCGTSDFSPQKLAMRIMVLCAQKPYLPDWKSVNVNQEVSMVMVCDEFIQFRETFIISKKNLVNQMKILL